MLLSTSFAPVDQDVIGLSLKEFDTDVGILLLGTVRTTHVSTAGS